MKIEEQVCSLELAKRLKKLGVKQQSALYWVVPTDETIHLSSLEFASAEKTIADGIIKKISAFTVAQQALGAETGSAAAL
jgi:hypothetical protein